MNKTVQDLKMEIEAINKTQTQEILEMENIGKRTGSTDASITKRIQEIEERVFGVEDRIEEIDTLVKNAKCKVFTTLNIQEI